MVTATDWKQTQIMSTKGCGCASMNPYVHDVRHRCKYVTYVYANMWQHIIQALEIQQGQF
jgi:hypothetical protein